MLAVHTIFSYSYLPREISKEDRIWKDIEELAKVPKNDTANLTKSPMSAGFQNRILWAKNFSRAVIE